MQNISFKIQNSKFKNATSNGYIIAAPVSTNSATTEPSCHGGIRNIDNELPSASNASLTPIKRKRGRPAKQSKLASPSSAPNEENLLGVFNFDDSFFVNDRERLDYTSLLSNIDSMLPDDDSDLPWLSDMTKFTDKSIGKLNICHLNINSIFNKLFEVYKIINSGTFDIISIQETKLGPEIPDSLFTFANYTTIRRDRQRGGGGLMVFIKHSVKLVSFNLFTESEAIQVVIESFCKKYTFLSIYNPSFNASASFLSQLDSILTSSNHNSKLFILGDLNHNLLNTNGTNLISLLSTYGFTNHVSNPTRITKKHQSLIDVFFSNHSDFIHSTEVIGCPFSDHSFVLTALNIKCQKFPCSFFKSRSLTAAKLNLIKAAISDISFSSFDYLTNVNDRWLAFCKILLDTIDIIAPYKQLRARKRTLEWIENDVRVLMRKRNKLFRLASASGLPRNDPIWDTVRLLRNKCKSLIRAKMKSFFADKTASFFKCFQKFWNFYRSSGTLKNKSNSSVISFITEKNNLITDSQAIAYTFNSHFTNLKPTSFFNDSDCSDFTNKSFIDYKRHSNLRTSAFSFSQRALPDLHEFLVHELKIKEKL